jgi:hypothetical protein
MPDPARAGLETRHHRWFAIRLSRLGHTLPSAPEPGASGPVSGQGRHRRPSLGHGRTTPTALIHPVNLLQEVAFYGADGGPS